MFTYWRFNKKKRQNDWFEKAAKEMDMLIDDEELYPLQSYFPCVYQMLYTLTDFHFPLTVWLSYILLISYTIHNLMRFLWRALSRPFIILSLFLTISHSWYMYFDMDCISYYSLYPWETERHSLLCYILLILPDYIGLGSLASEETTRMIPTKQEIKEKDCVCSELIFLTFLV